MADIYPNQDYDILYRPSFNTASGDCKIRLYRGSSTPVSGTVYYRIAWSGDPWTALNVTGTDTTFPILDTYMEVSHDWNKSGDDYTTVSFEGNTTNLRDVSIYQKATLSGTVGKYFFYNFVRGCTDLVSVDIPDTSEVTRIGNSFMHNYARDCTSLINPPTPELENLVYASGYNILYSFAYNSGATTINTPNLSKLQSAGNYFMQTYAGLCPNLITAFIPDTSSLTSIGAEPFQGMLGWCNSLTQLILPKAGYFATHDIDWGVPSNRLGILKGVVLDEKNLTEWKSLTVPSKTLYLNQIQNSSKVSIPVETKIDPTQDYDIIHTLTFGTVSGNIPIKLYRGSTTGIAGTVYYRAGTSGSWTQFDVSANGGSIPITDTTMQVAHDWNKEGNNYMTPSFYGYGYYMEQIEISQKAPISGIVGDYFFYRYTMSCHSMMFVGAPDLSNATQIGHNFMYEFTRECSKTVYVGMPKIGNVTSVGDNFMYLYAYSNNMTNIGILDTKNISSVGSYFMYQCVSYCSKLVSFTIPDTRNLTSVGSSFMSGLAIYDRSLTTLYLPKVGWFATHNVNWSIYSDLLGVIKGVVLDPDDLSDWRALVVSGKTLYTNYIRDVNNVIRPPVNDNSEKNIYSRGKLTDSSERGLYTKGKTQAYDAIIATITVASDATSVTKTMVKSTTWREGTSGTWLSTNCTLTAGNTYQFRTPLSGMSSSTTAVLPNIKASVAVDWDTTAIPISTLGNYFMRAYANGCSSLTSLSVPDTSGFTSVGNDFMYTYARNCSSLTSLILPDSTGWFGSNNVDWNVPSERLDYLYGYAPDSTSQTAWRALTVSGKTLYTNYIRAEDHVLMYGNSERNLYVHGIASSEQNLYIKGFDIGNSIQKLYTKGKIKTQSDRKLFIKGKASSNSLRGVYTQGQSSSQSERLLYTQGKLTNQSECGLYIKGIDTDYSESKIHLTGKDSNLSEVKLYLKGKIYSIDERGIRLVGKIDTNSIRGLYSAGKDTDESERGIYLEGIETNSERGVYIVGIAVSERGMLIIGKGGDFSERRLFSKGIDESDSVRGLYTVGSISDNSNRQLYLQGNTDDLSERNIFTKGSIDETSQRNLYTQGRSTSQSQSKLHITGKIKAESERGLFSIGIDTAESERGVYLDGLLGGDSERGIYIECVEASESKIYIIGIKGCWFKRFKSSCEKWYNRGKKKWKINTSRRNC